MATAKKAKKARGRPPGRLLGRLLNGKLSPVTVRLNEKERQDLEKAAAGSGIAASRLARICLLYTLPKILAGELNLLELNRLAVLEP